MAEQKFNSIKFEGLNFKGVNVCGEVSITEGALIWKFNDFKAFNLIFKEEKEKGVKVVQIGRKPAYAERCEGKSKEQLTEELQEKFKSRGIKSK